MFDDDKERPPLPNGITREVLEHDGLRAALAASDPEIFMVSDEVMRASIKNILATRPRTSPNEPAVHVFGYGSLLWNPCVPVVQWHDALLYGFHRDFQIRLTHGRGSPGAPGLMLGLVPGGSCRGMALQLPPADLEHELLMIWRREMLTGVYSPRWVRLHCGDRMIPAITFVTNTHHASFCGKQPDEKVVHMLANGVGTIGTAAAYLRNTVELLDRRGIFDQRLHMLQMRVESQRAVPVGGVDH